MHTPRCSRLRLPGPYQRYSPALPPPEEQQQHSPPQSPLGYCARSFDCRGGEGTPHAAVLTRLGTRTCPGHETGSPPSHQMGSGINHLAVIGVHSTQRRTRSIQDWSPYIYFRYRGSKTTATKRWIRSYINVQNWSPYIYLIASRDNNRRRKKVYIIQKTQKLVNIHTFLLSRVKQTKNNWMYQTTPSYPACVSGRCQRRIASDGRPARPAAYTAQCVSISAMIHTAGSN